MWIMDFYWPQKLPRPHIMNLLIYPFVRRPVAIPKNRFKIIYADKGYFGEPNRSFLSLNQIKDGIMRKDTTTAKLTEYEIERNKKISKKRYIVEQYFGLSHLHTGAKRARFTTIIKNAIDAMIQADGL